MPVLAVVPSLSVGVISDREVRLTQKFVEGMAQYCELWSGPVIAVIHPDYGAATTNLDERVFDLKRLPFEVRCVGLADSEIFHALNDCDVVMLGGDHRHRKLTRWCRARGKKVVFVAEYSLRTRFSIIRAEVSNPIIRLRRFVWELRQELNNRRDIRLAHAVQCNGTPTFLDYARPDRNVMRYFDNRVTQDMIPNSPSIAARLDSLKSGRPVRLAYSGRWVAMKGVHHLVEVASWLKSRGVPFIMDIIGDGPLRPTLSDMIKQRGLATEVFLHGVMEFSTELMPHVRDHVDLFVCCHSQGDPSCTYLETLSCGVPIIGYDNEAFRGILEIGPMGWLTPRNDPGTLAARIAELYASPEMLLAAARHAIGFARKHTFPIEFKTRIDQVKLLFDTGYPATARQE